MNTAGSAAELKGRGLYACSSNVMAAWRVYRHVPAISDEQFEVIKQELASSCNEFGFVYNFKDYDGELTDELVDDVRIVPEGGRIDEEQALILLVVPGGPVSNAVKLVQILEYVYGEGDDESYHKQPAAADCRHLWVAAKGASLVLANLNIANSSFEEEEDNVGEDRLIACDGDW